MYIYTVLENSEGMSPSGPKYVHVPGTLFIMYIYSVLETCEDFIMYILYCARNLCEDIYLSAEV